MGIFPEIDEDAIFLSRSDTNENLGTFSKHSFELDGALWPSVEHYFQAMKFEDAEYREKIRTAPHPKKARKLGRNRFKKIRKDWAKVKTVVMTRGVYIKCRTYPDISKQLLETEDRKLVENSQYDYYWGCGRDRRGDNHYGKVLMSVRGKLLAEGRDAEVD
jgi:ribA/ribD-fused uncharacterized protein